MSFRWRVFLVALATVILALATVLTLGSRRVLAHEQRRLEARLCMEARRLAEPTPPGPGAENWNRLGADLGLKLGVNPGTELRLRRWGADGGLLLESPLPLAADGPEGIDGVAWQAEPAMAPGPDPRGRCDLGSLTLDRSNWRLARVEGAQGRALLAADEAALTRPLVNDLRQALPLVLPLGAALAAASAWLLASLSTRPLRRLQDAMRSTTSQALGVRLSSAGEDREFRVLIEAYNTMLARLEASFQQASRFSADAAHELRTPLTILQGRLERAIAHSEGQPVQAELVAVQDEVARLAGITRKLLLLSQADAGRLPIQAEAVDLSTLLKDLTADAQMADEARAWQDQITAGLWVQGDRQLLRQAFNNLLGNALRHGLPGAPVTIEAHRDGADVAVTFRNACLPLDATQRSRFFQRFHRADAARGRQVDGTGLGLSIVREIVRAHGGEARLLPGRDDEVGLTVTLPAAPAPGARPAA